MNIKCRSSGLSPDCVVIVATVRALKMHGGGPPVVAGKPLDSIYRTQNVDLTRAGCCNLGRHIANLKKYGVPVVVGINRFATDTDAELEVVCEEALKAGGKAQLSTSTILPFLLFLWLIHSSVAVLLIANIHFLLCAL